MTPLQDRMLEAINREIYPIFTLKEDDESVYVQGKNKAAIACAKVADERVIEILEEMVAKCVPYGHVKILSESNLQSKITELKQSMI